MNMTPGEDKSQQLAEQNTNVEPKAPLIDSRTGAQRLSGELDEYRAAYERLAAKNFALEAELEWIKGSLAWKLMQAVENIRSMLIPVDTLRAALYHALLRRLGISLSYAQLIPPAPPRIIAPAPHEELLEQAMQSVRTSLKDKRRSAQH